MNRAIVEDFDLVADEFLVQGTGISGQAIGQTFEEVVPGTGGSVAVQVASGHWHIAVTVKNAAAASVGSGSGEVDVTIGIPAVCAITAVPYPGNGTFIADITWYPDVVAVPVVEVELLGFDAVLHPVEMTNTGPTAADGTIALPAGWYVGFLRILDNTELSAGLARAIRLAQGGTTTWSEYLQVNQLLGTIDIDLDYNPGEPLNLTYTPNAGSADVYSNFDNLFSVTGVDNDSGTTPIYAWYVDGVGTSLGAAASYTLNRDWESGEVHYLSVVVVQSDGKRAADHTWALTCLGTNPLTMQIDAQILGGTVRPGETCWISIWSATVETMIEEVEIPWVGNPADCHHTFTVPAGFYKALVRWSAVQNYPSWYGGGINWDGAGLTITVPHAAGLTFSW